MRCSSSRHKGPSSLPPFAKGSRQLRAAEVSKPRPAAKCRSFFPLCLGRNRVVPLATELSHGEMHSRDDATRDELDSFILRRSALSRYRRRHRTWFSLANFHGPCSRPPCSVSLFLSAHSGGIWRIGPEVDDLERVCSQPSRSLTSASELASFAGLSATGGKMVTFSFFLRGETWEIQWRRVTKGRISTLGYRQVRRNTRRVSSGETRSLTNFRTRPAAREIPLRLFLTRVPPHYFLLHSIFTLTSATRQTSLPACSSAPLHEIFSLIRGEG